MFRPGTGFPEVYAPAVPIIIPTLDSRVHGVFWSGAPSVRAAGLILLSESPVYEFGAEQVAA
jgi:hypothetical protein